MYKHAVLLLNINSMYMDWENKGEKTIRKKLYQLNIEAKEDKTRKKQTMKQTNWEKKKKKEYANQNGEWASTIAGFLQSSQL